MRTSPPTSSWPWPTSTGDWPAASPTTSPPGIHPSTRWRCACRVPSPPADIGSGPPCPDVADHHPAAAAIDLLVLRPRDHDSDLAAWDHYGSDLATAMDQAMGHWSGNPIQLQLRDPTETADEDDHDTAADWWLLAGAAMAGITADPPQDQATAPEPPIRAGNGHTGR